MIDHEWFKFGSYFYFGPKVMGPSRDNLNVRVRNANGIWIQKRNIIDPMPSGYGWVQMGYFDNEGFLDEEKSFVSIIKPGSALLSLI